MPNQLELLCMLASTGTVPDVAMGASGGNMALCICMLCDWQEDRVRAMVRTMSYASLVRRWGGSGLSSLLPPTLLGLLHGSMYDRADSDSFFTTDRDLSSACELWSLTHNKTQNSMQLFTNRACGQTRLNYTSMHVRALPLRYVAGDFTQLREIAMASAAVPGVQKVVVIENQEHVDGGMSMASPFSAFSDNIRHIGLTEAVHIVYVVGSNSNSRSHEPAHRSGFIETGMWTLHQLTEAAVCTDKAHVVDFLYSLPNFKHGRDRMRSQTYEGSVGTLRRVSQELRKMPASVLELSPRFNQCIDYTTFNSDDFASVMDLARDYFEIVAYWVEPGKS